MATEDNEYFTDIIDNMNEYQDRHGQRLSSKNLKETILRVMDEEEEKIERNINNITCDTPFQSPITKNGKKICKLVIRKTTCCRRSWQSD